MAAGIVEDIVVDVVLEVDRAVDPERVAAELVLPGLEILRAASSTTIWLTLLVAAASEADAVAQVRAAVLPQVPQAARMVHATVVTSAPLGELHARLDVGEDEAPESMTLRDLVEAHLWSQRDDPRARPVRGTRTARRRAG